MAPLAPSLRHPLVRAGIAVWTLVGLLVLAWLAGRLLDRLRVVVVPVVLALFPALLLAPVSSGLKRRGVPPALAALVAILSFLAGVVGVLSLVGVLLVDQLTELGDTLETSYEDVRRWLADNVGVDVVPAGELVNEIQERLRGAGGWAGRALTATTTTAEVAVGLIFGLVVLFFYLKDGARLLGWVVEATPDGWKATVEEAGRRVWRSLGGYFRGQILVALVDAVFIGLGLVVLRVPLALPLALLVLFGGLFPIVGAFVSGLLAALVALADGGIGKALAVVVLVVAVQQIEGNVLEPLIVGRATELHPLLVVVAVAAGGVLLGLLGAFLAVPVVAATARVVDVLRERQSAAVGEGRSGVEVNRAEAEPGST
jgi:putative heme transporter